MNSKHVSDLQDDIKDLTNRLEVANSLMEGLVRPLESRSADLIKKLIATINSNPDLSRLSVGDSVRIYHYDYMSYRVGVVEHIYSNGAIDVRVGKTLSGLPSGYESVVIHNF